MCVGESNEFSKDLDLLQVLAKPSNQRSIFSSRRNKITRISALPLIVLYLQLNTFDRYLTPSTPLVFTMHLMYNEDPNTGKRIYTLKKVMDGVVTKSAHPARFSPDDKYSRCARSRETKVEAKLIVMQT